VSGNLVLFVLLVAAFYLLVIAPARNRSRRLADIKAHLRPGAEVITTSGMFGRVDRVVDDEMYLEIAPGVVVRFATAAIGKILVPKEEPKGSTNPDDAEDEDPPAAKTL
jgi:preprotein translocase subunit YajC